MGIISDTCCLETIFFPFPPTRLIKLKESFSGLEQQDLFFQSFKKITIKMEMTAGNIPLL